MSRTMKAEEAISALAFLSNPDELKNDAPEIRDDSFRPGIRGSIARGLTKALSEAKLDLYRKASSGSLRNLDKKNSVCSSAQTQQSSTMTANSDEEKGVCFGTVEVRKYPITIGTNPSVSRGVPCTLEWDHLEDETEKHHIDAYERERPNEERKHGDDLIMDGMTRAKMLKNLGYTKQELLEGMRKVHEYKTRRKSDTKESRVSSAR